MTIHEALKTAARQPLMTMILLIVILQMFLVINSFQNNRKRQVKIFHSVHHLAGLLLFYSSMRDIFWEQYFPNGSKALPTFLHWLASCPVYMMILLEILAICILAVSVFELIDFRKTHPTFDSLKEAMDLLPVGIAFAKNGKDVVFRNIAIRDLSRTLTGKMLNDLSAFKNAVMPDDEAKLTLSEGTVWHLENKSLTVDNNSYTQLTATDITKQEEITKDLEEKNGKLRDMHMRLDIYNKQADRIIISQELLTARMAVHSEVGNVLLESRHYLTDPSSIDEEKLLQALKNTNTYLLREYEEDDTERDPLADAFEMADAIGVDVMITGKIPSDDPFRSCLAAAINECASNTVKHANGDELMVSIRETDKEIVFVLKSNGKAPEEEIRESGGLLSLRSLVENELGSMTVQISPGFTLFVRIPLGRSNM